MDSTRLRMVMGFVAGFVLCTGCGASGGDDPPSAGSGAGDSSSASGTAGAGATSGGDAGRGAAGSASVGGSGGIGGIGGGPSGTGGTSSGGSNSSGGGPGGSGPPLPGCDAAPVATAPSSQWVNATGNLANMPSGCGTLGKVVAKPCSTTVVAAVTEKGLWSSTDRGKTWIALGTGPGSATITNHSFSLFFDPVHHDVMWETGLHNGSGVYTSKDDGLTFARLGTMIESQLVSVDFKDPARKTLVSGTHGQTRAVFLSTDAGVSWTNIGLTLPAASSNSESPVVIDAKTYIVGVCNSAQQGCGFYRTADSGASWTMKSDLQASHFGSPLWASDGAIYWPLLLDAGVGKSTDQGETWTNIAKPNTIVGITPIELPDGSIVVVGPDHLLRSKNGGTSWEPIGEPIPFALAGNQAGNVTYSPLTKSFFMSHWECGSSVAPGAIMTAGFDYSK